MAQMVTVTLECDDGELVSQVAIPLQDPMPQVLQWGTRVFKIYDELNFREVFPYTIPLEAVR